MSNKYMNSYTSTEAGREPCPILCCWSDNSSIAGYDEHAGDAKQQGEGGHGGGRVDTAVDYH